MNHRIRELVRCNARRQRGGAVVEYVLILALIVFPLAAMLPMFVHMIVNYAGRMSTIIRLPFP